MAILSSLVNQFLRHEHHLKDPVSTPTRTFYFKRESNEWDFRCTYVLLRIKWNYVRFCKNCKWWLLLVCIIVALCTDAKEKVYLWTQKFHSTCMKCIYLFICMWFRPLTCILLLLVVTAWILCGFQLILPEYYASHFKCTTYCLVHEYFVYINLEFSLRLWIIWKFLCAIV
jgi:hypothetical protein